MFALALGTFAIGTGEFGSNGAIQLFASDLNVSIPVATHAITAYALGVGGCCAGVERLLTGPRRVRRKRSGKN